MYPVRLPGDRTVQVNILCASGKSYPAMSAPTGSMSDLLGSLVRYTRKNWVLVVLLAAAAYATYSYATELKGCSSQLHAIQLVEEPPKEKYTNPTYGPVEVPREAFSGEPAAKPADDSIARFASAPQA